MSNRARWLSIALTYICVFAMCIQQSCYWTSLWPYMSQVDSSVSESFVGYVIAAYSLGQGLAAPIFGWWSNRTFRTKLPVLCGILVNIAGNLVIALIEAFPETSRHWIFLSARFVCGVGAGNTGTLTAYVAMASHLSERNKAMTIQSATISLSTLAGPGIAAIMTPIGYPGSVVARGSLHFDMYSSIAYFSVFLSLVVFVLMLLFFSEHYVIAPKRSVVSRVSSRGSRVSRGRSISESITKPNNLNMRSFLTAMFVRFTMLFGMSCDQSISSPYTMAMFGWSRKESVFKNSFIVMMTGVVTFGINLLTGLVLLRFVKERLCILVGISASLLYFLFIFPYPDILPAVQVIQHNISNNLSSTVAPGETLGCDYAWCSHMTTIPMWSFVLAYVSIGIAFPITFTPNTVLFSKILGNRKQGFLQGTFVAVGTLATAFGPILIANLFEHSGPRVAFSVVGSVNIVCLFVHILNYAQMVPAREVEDRTATNRCYENGSFKEECTKL